jgi:hypothetical protein
MNTEAQSKNWNDLPNIQNVQPFIDADEACLNEVKAVLEKYDRASRFGVALLHKHFVIGADEVLIERSDPQNRTLITEPMKTSQTESRNLITTIWRFDNGVRYACSFCNKDHCT